MSFEEALEAFAAFDVSNGRDKTKPTAGVFCKLRIRGLKENLDPIEGRDNGFGLRCLSTVSPSVCRQLQRVGSWGEKTYRTPRQTPRNTAAYDIVYAALVHLFRGLAAVLCLVWGGRIVHRGRLCRAHG